MGCGGSKGKYAAKDVRLDDPVESHPAETEPVQESADPDTDNGRLIDAIASRVSSIRAKAEEYRAQLQEQVVEIEQQRAVQSPSAGDNENGVVVASYRPSEDAGGTSLIEALEGERLEIIVRDAGGWAYCRRRGASRPGWLPAARVVEIAALVADHQGEGTEGLLSVKRGETVEVVSRHYSGWAFCREWTGPPLPGSPDERKEGWVTDAYLEDRRSEAMLASKWHRLVLQALDQVVLSSRELEIVLAQAKSEDWRNDLSQEWMGQCLEFASWLTTELGAISQAVSQREQATSSTGSRATAAWDVAAGGPTELPVAKGERVVILDAENPDWAWCRSEASGREGWVPQGALSVEEQESGTADSRGVERQLTHKDLPPWVKEGETCQWWSASGNRYCDVRVSQVDPERREVKVVFAVDATCWKCVGFDHFAQPSELWLLQPRSGKIQELQNQLPEWLQVGHSAFWWSMSQKRCLSVTIKDVCFRSKMVSVAFDLDKRVRKSVPLYELIDEPQKCLLQKDREGHAWRTAKTAASGATPPDALGSADDSPSPLPKSPRGFQDPAFHQSAAEKLGDLFNDMQKDLGDMLGDDALAAGCDDEASTLAESPAQELDGHESNSGSAPADQVATGRQSGALGAALAAARGGTPGEVSGNGSPRCDGAGLDGHGEVRPRRVSQADSQEGGGARDRSGPGAAASDEGIRAPSSRGGAAQHELVPEGGAPTEAREGRPTGVSSSSADVGCHGARADAEELADVQGASASQPAAEALLHTLSTGTLLGDAIDGSLLEAAGAGTLGGASATLASTTLANATLASDADVDEALRDLAALQDAPLCDVEPPMRATGGAPVPPAAAGPAAPPRAVPETGGAAPEAGGAAPEAGGAVPPAPPAPPAPTAPAAPAAPEGAGAAAAPAGPPPPLLGAPGAGGAGAPGAGGAGAGASAGAAQPAPWSSQGGGPGAPGTPPAAAASGAPEPPWVPAAPPAPGGRPAVSAWGAEEPADGKAALPPTLPPADAERPEERGVTWAEPCANTPPSKRRGGSQPTLEYTTSEQDLMENLGDRTSEISEGGTLFNTMEKELIQELTLDSPGPSPKGDRRPQLLGRGPEGEGEGRPGEAAPPPRRAFQAFAEGPAPRGGTAAAPAAAAAPGPGGGAAGGSPRPGPREAFAADAAGAPALAQAWGTSTAWGTSAAGGAPGAPGRAAAWGQPGPQGSQGPAGPQGQQGQQARARYNAWGGGEEPEPAGAAARAGGSPAGARPASLQEALRVISPEAWDSEGEGTALPPPDVARVAAAWPELGREFDASQDSAVAQFDEELAGELAEAEAGIAAKVEELRDALEQRARAAESQLNPTAAQQHRSLVWGVVNRAEGTREARHRSRKRRLELRRRRATSQREALSRALGANPSGMVAASFTPDVQALEDLSTAEAVAEVAESAQGIFRALQVTVLRAPASASRAQEAPPSDAQGLREERSQAAWEDGDAQQAHGRAFAKACEAAAEALGASLGALATRLERLGQEAPPLDEALEAVVRGEEGLTKAQKREKAMFEGQQEYSHERSLGLRLQEQAARHGAGAEEAVVRAERALRRRLERRRGRTRPEALRGLGALRGAMEEAEHRLEELRREHREKAESEAARMEMERRDMQEQTQAMLLAAMVIRQEKGRMNKAWEASVPRERSKLMRVALRRVRRLNHDMKNLQVTNELKQKHSVLLYSLRMLEARLQTECPDAKHEMEEGRLEETPEQRQQLEEAAAAFEAQLARDVAALRAAHEARGERAAARLASRLRRTAEEELADAVPAASGALEASAGAAALAALAGGALRPFASALARLRVEACRHQELERGPSDDSGFGPKRRRLDAAIETTLYELRKLRPELEGHAPSLDEAQAQRHDPEWEAAIAATESSWRAFCERHPLLDAADGSETPRSEAEDEQPALLATETLIFDDLEAPEATAEASAPAAAPPGTASGGRRLRGARGAAPAAAVPKAPQGPASPSARGSPGPPGAKPLAATRGSRAGPPGPPSRAGSSTAGGRPGNATALLAQLDELNNVMDATLQKAGALSGHGPAHGKAPPPPRKPGVPTARRGRAA